MNFKKAIGGALLTGVVTFAGLTGTAATAFASAATPNASSETTTSQVVDNAVYKKPQADSASTAKPVFWKYYNCLRNGQWVRCRKWIP